MSTITVNNPQQLAAALAAAVDGDTISIGPGTYDAPLTITHGVTLQGASGAILTGGITIPHTVRGLHITGLTFSSCGVSWVECGLIDSSITDNTFHLPPNGTTIYGWVTAPPDSSKANPAAWNAACQPTWQNLLITRNRFVGSATYAGQCEAIHLRADTPAPPGADNGPGKSFGLSIVDNLFERVSRCPIEYQGGGTGTKITDNIIRDFTLSPTQSVNGGTMPISAAADASVGTIIQRNFIDGTGSNPPFWVTGIEFAGHRGDCSDNYIRNGNQALILQNPYDGKIHDNRVENVRQIVGTGDGQPHADLIQNNGPNVTLSWDINRPWPLTASAPTHATPQPTPTPTGANVPTYTGKVINSQAALSDGTVDTGTSNVVKVFQVNGVWYQLNSANQVWTLPGLGARNVTGQVQAPSDTPTIVSTDVVIHYSDGSTRTLVGAK